MNEELKIRLERWVKAMRNRTLVIDGYNRNRTHVIHTEVDGAREANQVLKSYIEKYPDYTFTMKPKES